MSLTAVGKGMARRGYGTSEIPFVLGQSAGVSREYLLELASLLLLHCPAFSKMVVFAF